MRRLDLLLSTSLLALAACRTAGTKPPAAAPAKVPAAKELDVDPSIIDRAAKPCDDFYQYACGGWLAKTAIPADRPRWSRGFDEIHERNEKMLRAFLENDALGKGNPGDVYGQKLGDFYASCMDEAKVEAQGLQGLEGDFAAVATVKDAASLEKVVAHLHDQGIGAIFSFGSAQDLKDATQVIGEVDQGGLGLPDRDYYTKDDPKSKHIRELYLAHVARMLELAGDAAAAQAEAEVVMRLEHALAEASLTRTELRDPKKLYHRLELAGLEKAAPRFLWASYLTDLGHAEIHAINVSEPGFVEAVSKLIAKTPAKDWQIYLRWHILHSTAAALPKAFVDEDFHFSSTALTGTAQILPRWKRCVAATDRLLGFALARPFVEATFGEEGKERSVAMVHTIERAFGDDLKGLGWMDDATRKRADEKLHLVANKIGYPDKWRDYSKLSIGRDAYLGNVLAGRGFEVQRDLDKIGKPLDRTEWEMTPPTVNAYYEPSMNEMVFPAGILQSPYFNRDAPVAVNYGGIGMVMGHELTHGFDDEGSQFDGHGNLSDWWSAAAKAQFTARAECVAKQFDGYVAVDDLHLNGHLTLGENIADLGGMKLAYHALAQAEGDQLAEDGPDGFTRSQRFFLSFAQSWCTKARDAYARMLVTVDPHSPPRFRVNGPLSNLPEFAKAFSCPAGSPMARHPAQRCEVW